MPQALASIAVAAALAVSCVACDKLKPPLPEIQKPPAVTVPAAPQDTDRKAFTQAAQQELNGLAAAIAELRTKARTLNAQAQVQANEELLKLEAQKHEVQQRLADLESATLENWSGMKQTFGSALEKLKTGVDAIRKSAK